MVSHERGAPPSAPYQFFHMQVTGAVVSDRLPAVHRLTQEYLNRLGDLGVTTFIPDPSLIVAQPGNTLAPSTLTDLELRRRLTFRHMEIATQYKIPPSHLAASSRVAHGYTDQEVATALDCSINSVKWFTQSVRRCLGLVEHGGAPNASTRVRLSLTMAGLRRPPNPPPSSI